MLATNVAAISLFAAKGHIWWQVALVMAVANVLGQLGGHAHGPGARGGFCTQHVCAGGRRFDSEDGLRRLFALSQGLRAEAPYPAMLLTIHHREQVSRKAVFNSCCNRRIAQAEKPSAGANIKNNSRNLTMSC